MRADVASSVDDSEPADSDDDGDGGGGDGGVTAGGAESRRRRRHSSPTTSTQRHRRRNRGPGAKSSRCGRSRCRRRWAWWGRDRRERWPRTMTGRCGSKADMSDVARRHLDNNNVKGNHHNHHHHQLNTHECSTNNKIHDKTHKMVQNDVMQTKLEKVAHTRLPSVGFRSWSRFFAVSLQVTWVINLAVGCHYFPPGLQLPSQSWRRGLLPISLLREQRHDGCEQLA